MIIVTVVLVVVVAFLTLAILAGIYLTGGQTYEVLVARTNIPANAKIKDAAVQVKEVDEEPPSSVITDKSQVVGKVTKEQIEKGSNFKPGQLRDKFKVVKTLNSIPPGNRIQASMVTVAKVDESPPNAVSEVSQLTGKMVREGIPANVVVREKDVYQSEQKIVVATESIASNSMVREGQIRVVSRPTAPPDAISDPNKVTGRALKRGVDAGDVIRSTDLFPNRKQLSYFVPLYRRAVSIPVSNYNNVSYMLRPGDQVDLYVYLPQGFSRGRQNNNQDQLHTDMLKKVADGSEVLSLNDVFTQKRIQQIESGGENNKPRKFTYQEMTLGVTIWEAEKINLIRGQQQAGASELRFFVILRPRQLDSKYGYRSVTNYDLFNKELGNQAARETNGPSVKVIQGEEESVYRVPRYK